MEFPDRLRALREARGWSQNQLANEVGVHLMTVYKWERASHRPGFEELLRLAEVLGVSLDELAGRQRPAPPIDQIASDLRGARELLERAERALGDFSRGTPTARSARWRELRERERGRWAAWSPEDLDEETRERILDVLADKRLELEEQEE